MQNLHTRYVSNAIEAIPPTMPPIIAPILGALLVELTVEAAVKLGLGTQVVVTQTSHERTI